MLRSNFNDFCYLPADRTKGGILIACRTPDVNLTLRSIGSFLVTVDLTIGDEPWCLTSVYGPQADEDKLIFLDELRAIHASLPHPWLLMGDFNLILDAKDKNNQNINRRNIGRFRRFMDET